ncbi:hypothetical protein EVAR_32630_1 [Eumeta japonica]|uniref:Pre-C2HC domain-containing protein n=1 Tax=Eumeta variegata TaxID=151549 RepID=A0A4C1WJU6_EUMVA|nr:hypothetical protein EVAR_32630_1 [Eumeta japonica]
MPRTFRNLNINNKYLIDNKVKFHTYALEDERKLKAVIRGVPADFDINDIKSDLLNQGFPQCNQCTAYVDATVPLCGIRVEASRNRGGPGQYHRYQPPHIVTRILDLIHNDANFPELKEKPSPHENLAFCPDSVPSNNPWGRIQPQGPSRSRPGSSFNAHPLCHLPQPVRDLLIV